MSEAASAQQQGHIVGREGLKVPIVDETYQTLSDAGRFFEKLVELNSDLQHKDPFSQTGELSIPASSEKPAVIIRSGDHWIHNGTTRQQVLTLPRELGKLTVFSGFSRVTGEAPGSWREVLSDNDVLRDPEEEYSGAPRDQWGKLDYALIGANFGGTYRGALWVIKECERLEVKFEGSTDKTTEERVNNFIGDHVQIALDRTVTLLTD